MDALAPFAQVRNWEEDWSVTPEAGKTESKSSKSEGRPPTKSGFIMFL